MSGTVPVTPPGDDEPMNATEDDMAMTDSRDIADYEPDETSTVVDEPGTAVELSQPGAVGTYLPSGTEWSMICQQADVLAQSDLVPSAYRRKPANIVLATLAGRPHKWDASMSMRSFHIIEGQPTMKPELMLALVRAAGHSVAGEASPDGARITGTRGDNGDTLTVSFTLDNAVQAGLCQIKDGRPFARSSNGKVLPWEQYPEDMCWARTVSKLCRRLFPDVIMGAGYVPEEFGMQVNESGDVIEVDSVEMPGWASGPSAPPEPETIDDAEAQALKSRASALPTDAKEELRNWARGRESHLRFSSFTPGQARATEAFIAGLEKRAGQGEWGEWVNPAAPKADTPTEDVTDAVVICDRCDHPEDDCQCDVPDNPPSPSSGQAKGEPDIMDSATIGMLLKLPDDGLLAIGRAELEAACRGVFAEFDDSCDDQDLVDLLRMTTEPM